MIRKLCKLLRRRMFLQVAGACNSKVAANTKLVSDPWAIGQRAGCQSDVDAVIEAFLAIGTLQGVTISYENDDSC